MTVSEFLGDPADDELPRLAAYLDTLRDVQNVRAIEKRRWRERIDAGHDPLAGYRTTADVPSDS